MFYSVMAVTPTSEHWIPGYVTVASDLVAKYGGKYLARTSSHAQLEGEVDEAALRIVIEWPSREAALAFMQDPAYLPHLDARTAGSNSQHHLVEGTDDLA